MNKKLDSVREKLQIHWQRRVEKERIDTQLSLYIPTMLGYTEKDAIEGRLSGVDEMQNFLTTDKKLMLLLGDSGAGKSLFGLWWVNHLWEQDQGSIPIFIHLPAIKIKIGFLENYLKKHCGLRKSEIEELRTQHQILLILDSYDEMKSDYKEKNVHEIGELFRWNVKVVISCRTESLIGYSNSKLSDTFEPFSASRKKENSFEKRYVQAFDSKTQIPAYIEQWKQHNSELVDPRLDYVELLTTLRHVSEMITNPFILWIVLLSLPKILQRYADEKSLQRMHLTRLSLFDAFTSAWFERQRDKLVRNGVIDLKRAETIVGDYRLYCEQLANVMWQKNVNSVKYVAKEKPSLENEWDVFFAPEGNFNGDPNTPLHRIRSGALLRFIEGDTYEFLHESLSEYFSAKNMFESAANKASIVLGLEINTQLFVNDLARIRLGADCVQDNPEFEEALWEILEESKHEALVSTAAANAATILAAANRSFAGKDLSRIRIRHANVLGGNFDGTNLQEGDFRDVSFAQTWLNKANLSGAFLDGTNFGELISDKLDSIVQACEFTNDGQFYMVLTKTTLSIFEADTHKIVKIYQPKLQNSAEYLKCFALYPQRDKLMIGTNDGNLMLISFPSCKSLSVGQRWSYELDWLGVDSHAEYVFVANKWHCSRLKVKDENYIEVNESPYMDDLLTCNVLSPKGSWVLCGTNSGTIFSWNCTSDPKEYVRQPAASPITALAISRNELWAISGSADCRMRKWEVISGRCLETWMAYSIIRCIVVSSDGRLIFTGADDHTIRMWDASSGTCVNVWQGHSGPVTSLSISSDTNWLLSGSQDETVKRWKIEIKHLEAVWLKQDKLSFKRAISPDGRWAVTSICRKITLWEIGIELNWENRGEVDVEEQGVIESLTISSNGKCAFIFDNDHYFKKRKTLWLWDLQSGILKTVYKKRTLTQAVTINPSANSLLFGLNEGGIKCLNVETDSLIYLQEEEYHKSSFSHRVFYRIGKWLEKKFSDTDTSDSESEHEFLIVEDPNKPKYAVTTLAFSPDGSWVLVGAEFNTIKVWNVEKSQFVATWSAHTDKVISFGFSHCGRWVFSAGEDYKLILWEWSTGVIRWESILPQKVESISWSKNNPGKVIMGMKDGSFSIWQFNNQTFSLQLNLRSKPWGLSSNQCCVLGVYGLSLDQLRVLERKGSQVQVSSKSTQELIDKRSNIEAIYDPQVPISCLFDSTITLRPEAWAVSIVRKKKLNQKDTDVGRHVCLVLESIEDGYYRIRQIDFFIELRLKHSSAFGQGLIEVTNKPLYDMEALLPQCSVQSSGITPEQGEQLLKNIRADQANCIGYNLAGAGSIYRFFRVKEATEHHNCISWCKKHLDNIGVNIIQREWFDPFFEDPLIELNDKKPAQKSPRKQFSPRPKDRTDSNDPNRGEKCMVM